MPKKLVKTNFLIKAEKDVEVAKDLFRLKHYDWCLFIWHLAIEKILKAKIVSNKKEIIYTHDLVRLTKCTDMIITEELKSQLNEITTFNIEARYDDYKLSFYKKANAGYTEKWTNICEQIYNSIKKSI